MMREGNNLIYTIQLVLTYNKELIDYYGVAILLNLSKLAGRAVFYCLYGSVPFF